MVFTSDEVYELLKEVKDPEIPSVDIVGLGIVRDVEANRDAVRVTITPTYSGCPAMHQIEKEIVTCLLARGFTSVEVVLVHHPAWSTDWMSEEAKQNMKEAGIAPPGKVKEQGLVTINPLDDIAEVVACPFCDSTRTELRSQFGSTACKALYFCNSCTQPFDYFKSF